MRLFIGGIGNVPPKVYSSTNMDAKVSAIYRSIWTCRRKGANLIKIYTGTMRRFSTHPHPRTQNQLLQKNSPIQATAHNACINGTSKVEGRIKGRATPEDTANYCQRLGVPASVILSGSELEVSMLGFGTMRMDVDDPEHLKSFQYGIENGVNVIDTAPNFMKGMSEKMVGVVVQKSINEGSVCREELVIMSKGGYLTNELLTQVKGLAQPVEIVGLATPGSHHCVHPEVLSISLTHSLKQLNIECLDVFFINNPEIFLLKSQRMKNEAEALKLLSQCFERLEEEVAKGRIKYYGISSQMFNKHACLGIDSLLKMAKEIAGENAHHFKAIQYPMNVYEHGPKPSIGSLEDDGLWHFTQRLLTAVTPQNKLVRLSEYPIDRLALKAKGLSGLDPSRVTILDEDMSAANTDDYSNQANHAINKLSTLFQQSIKLEKMLQAHAPRELLEKLNVEVRTRAQELARNQQLLDDVFVLEHFVKTLVLPSADLTAKLVAAYFHDRNHGNHEFEYHNNTNSMNIFNGNIISNANANSDADAGAHVHADADSIANTDTVVVADNKTKKGTDIKMDNNMKYWGDVYIDSMRDLCEEIVLDSKRRANDKAKNEISVLLNSIVPELKSSETLAAKMLRLNISHTQVACTLVGMTSTDYVKDLITALKEPEISISQTSRVLDLPLFK